MAQQKGSSTFSGGLIRNMMKFCAYWFIPRGIQDVYLQFLTKRDASMYSDLCDANRKFKNLHAGRRCFIVANGPSINRQDLTLLKNEVVFSVSSGYLHKDYALFRPRYHCNAPLPFSDKLTKEVAIDWLRQMDSRIGTAELFLGAEDEAFVRTHSLFPSRRINYIWFGNNIEVTSGVMDIAGRICGVQSVTVMAIIIAMYMGFRKIYLLGCEHDSFITGRYKHFYANSPEYENKDTAVGDNGRVVSLFDELQATASLWKQYSLLRSIGEDNGIDILNATQGGALDVYDRVKYESLFGNADVPVHVDAELDPLKKNA